VAPPKSKQQLQQEAGLREPAERHGDVESEGLIKDDPMAKVDMTPWYYTRTVLFAVLVGWLVLLTGRIVELTMGERMLVTNPGAPPWTRTGQWYGWEHGPISSKHYAHVTPQRGHWAWQKGWGPQGQQELWASDMFGFAPEADAWWAEETGPEPRIGAAGIGENTWAKGTIAYGTNEPGLRPTHSSPHDWLGSGGHRRLRSTPEVQVEIATGPVVPLAVQWPAALEPDFLACGPHAAAGGAVAALTSNGLGALVPAAVAGGQAAGGAATLALKGLLELGMARGVTWAGDSLHVVTGSGTVATCPGLLPGGGNVRCSPRTSLPKLPLASSSRGVASPAVLLEAGPEEAPLRAAVAGGGRLSLLELREADELNSWQAVHELDMPDVAPVALSHSAGQLVLLAEDGATFRWEVRGSELANGMRHEVPIAGPRRAWRSACALPDGRVMRLAANWRKAAEGAFKWHPELLL